MEILHLPSATRVLGVPAEHDHTECEKLPVMEYEADGHHWMVSAWRPSTEELSLLIQGGHIVLTVNAKSEDEHPVVGLGVEKLAVSESQSLSIQIDLVGSAASKDDALIKGRIDSAILLLREGMGLMPLTASKRSMWVEQVSYFKQREANDWPSLDACHARAIELLTRGLELMLLSSSRRKCWADRAQRFLAACSITPPGANTSLAHIADESQDDRLVCKGIL